MLIPWTHPEAIQVLSRRVVPGEKVEADLWSMKSSLLQSSALDLYMGLDMKIFLSYPSGLMPAGSNLGCFTRPMPPTETSYA